MDTGGISFQSIVEGGQVRVREEGGFGSKLAYLDPLDGKMLCRWAMGLGAAMRRRGGGSIEGEAVAARVYAFSQQHIFLQGLKKWTPSTNGCVTGCESCNIYIAALIYVV